MISKFVKNNKLDTTLILLGTIKYLSLTQFRMECKLFKVNRHN